MTEVAYPVVVVQRSAPPVVVRNDRSSVVAFGAVSRASVVCLGFAGPQGIQGLMGPPGVALTITAQAAVNMTYPTIVAIVNGVAHPADPASIADMTSQLAVTTQAALAGQPVICASQLSLTESAWNWSAGRVYLSDTPGQMSQTPAARAVLEVARAVTPTTLDFSIQTATLRAA